MNDSEVLEALYIVISEFEDNPLPDEKINDTMIEILSERIESILN